MIRVLFIIIVCILLFSCSEEYLASKGEVIDSYVVNGPKGYGFRDVSKIIFEREGRVDTTSIIHTGIKLNNGDSVLFSLNIKKPRKSKLKQIISKYDGSEAYIPLDTPREKLSEYHAIDKQPLFKGVTNYVDNDSVVQAFLKKELLRYQKVIPNRIGLYLIIDITGKVSLGKVYDSDVSTKNNLREIVDSMPLFEPGEHKGKKSKSPI